MSFYRDTIRKAKKEHKCELCKATIMVGEQYHDKAGKTDDMWYTKECETCQPIITDYLHSLREHEYSEDNIKYWWQEEKCPKCIHYWPICEPIKYCPTLETGQKNSSCDGWESGKCKAGDYCDDMTHYCRCENFKEVQDEL